MRHTLAAIGIAIIALIPAAAQDYKASSITIEEPWIRATPSGAQVAGGYMKITNSGKELDRLIGGSTSIADKLELHEMRMEGSVMRMRELNKGLELKPGQTVELKPGSYHVMLTDLKQPAKEGDTVKGTLVFEKAGKVDVEYTVRGAGTKGSSKSNSHGGHGMKH